MDVSVMFLAVLNLIGFETESGKELFVGLPTTLDLGFDRVTVRDVFHGLLFMAMEDDCKVFDPGLRVQCGVARSKDDVESGAGYRETFRWNIRGGPRVKIDVQVVIAVVTMPELEKLKTEVGGSTFRVVGHGTIFVRADSLEEFGEQSRSGLRSTAVSSWMVLGTPWMLLVVLVMDRTFGKSLDPVGDRSVRPWVELQLGWRFVCIVRGRCGGGHLCPGGSHLERSLGGHVAVRSVRRAGGEAGRCDSGSVDFIPSCKMFV